MVTIDVVEVNKPGGTGVRAGAPAARGGFADGGQVNGPRRGGAGNAEVADAA